MKNSENVSNTCSVISMDITFYLYIYTTKIQNSNNKCELNYEDQLRDTISVFCSTINNKWKIADRI